MSKQDLFFEYLKEEGYVPHLDNDGDIIFKSEGISYLLFQSEDDPEYFRLSLPFFWSIDNPGERQRAMAAATTVNAEVKVVKLYLVDDNTWASVEMLIDPIENFRQVFPRCLRLLRHGVSRFTEIMKTPVQ